MYVADLFVDTACFCAVGAAVDEPELDMARFAYVYNTDYDQVLYALNEDKILYPASTAKMMTAILALEYYEGKIDTRITITQEMLDLSGGTVVSYKLGEVLSVEQLLYGLVVANGNDAAYALALSIAGTVDGFVTLMNQKAAALGAKDTRYANPTGVDHNSAYTTAADVARIAGLRRPYGGFYYHQLLQEIYDGRDQYEQRAGHGQQKLCGL